MHQSSTSAHFNFGVAAGAAVAVFCVMYGMVLVGGLVNLPSSSHQIQDPWFTSMEVLILLIAPAMVSFTVALHDWVPAAKRPMALLSIVFMGMCAALTSSVHFAILLLSREPAFASEAWARLIFAFTWPSVAYALDVLAWDVFFALAAFFAAVSVSGTSLHGPVRALLFASAVLSLIGLLGLPLVNMNVRNIGIVGYAVLFPIATALAIPALGQVGVARWRA